jgi:hypothetical protein
VIRPNPFLPSGSSFSICIPLFIFSHATVRLRPYSSCLARTGNASSGNVSSQCVVRGDGDYPESVVAMRRQRHCKSHTQAAGALQKWMQLWLWPTVLFHLPSVCFKVAAWHDAPHCLPWCYGRLGSKVFVTRTYENTKLSVSAYQRLIEWLDLKNLWYHHISSKALLYRSMANLVAMIAPH